MHVINLGVDLSLTGTCTLKTRPGPGTNEREKQAMLSIGEFSTLSKVTPKTLRYYDEIGLVKPAQVNPHTGYRYYEVSQLRGVLLIGRLKAYGFTLEEIGRVLETPENSETLPSLIRQKQDELRQKVQAYRYVLQQLEDDLANLERGKSIMSYLDTIAVTLTEPKPQTILSIRDTMDVSKYSDYMTRLYKSVEQKGLTPVGPPMTIFQGAEFTTEGYDMEIGVPVAAAGEGTRLFAPGLCATATLNGPYTELPAMYTKIKEWMEAEGYTPAEAPYEIYLTNPADVAPEDNVTEIYFPVKK